MFIRYSDAHQDIAITCITYLSFSCFDINITDEEVKENILSGEYCLHLYAERNWMYHVKHAIELDHDDSWTQSFVSLLVKFVQLRLDESLPQMVANQDIPSDGRFLEILNPSPNVQRHLINYYIFNSGEGLSKGISCESTLAMLRYICLVDLFLIRFCKSTPLHYKNRRKGLDRILKIFSLPLRCRMIRTNFKVSIKITVETYSSVLECNAYITLMGLTPKTKETSIWIPILDLSHVIFKGAILPQ
jgi:hypothetical protein